MAHLIRCKYRNRDSERECLKHCSPGKGACEDHLESFLEDEITRLREANKVLRGAVEESQRLLGVQVFDDPSDIAGVDMVNSALKREQEIMEGLTDSRAGEG